MPHFPTKTFVPVTLLAALLSLTATAFAADTVSSSKSSVTASPDADNTAVNRKDRENVAPTPLDQSNDRAALKVSADIRKAVVGDKDLSMMAHNVKIMTQNNTVTLRGPVKTMEERARVEQLARQHAGAAEVRNELTVQVP